MSASGKVFSHGNSRDNYVDRGWRFTQGEVVVLKIDTNLHRVKITNEGGTKKALVFY